MANPKKFSHYLDQMETCLNTAIDRSQDEKFTCDNFSEDRGTAFVNKSTELTIIRPAVAFHRLESSKGDSQEKKVQNKLKSFVRFEAAPSVTSLLKADPFAYPKKKDIAGLDSQYIYSTKSDPQKSWEVFSDDKVKAQLAELHSELNYPKMILIIKEFKFPNTIEENIYVHRTLVRHVNKIRAHIVYECCNLHSFKTIFDTLNISKASEIRNADVSDNDKVLEKDLKQFYDSFSRTKNVAALQRAKASNDRQARQNAQQGAMVAPTVSSPLKNLFTNTPETTLFLKNMLEQSQNVKELDRKIAAISTNTFVPPPKEFVSNLRAAVNKLENTDIEIEFKHTGGKVTIELTEKLIDELDKETEQYIDKGPDRVFGDMFRMMLNQTRDREQINSSALVFIILMLAKNSKNKEWQNLIDDATTKAPLRLETLVDSMKGLAKVIDRANCITNPTVGKTCREIDLTTCPPPSRRLSSIYQKGCGSQREVNVMQQNRQKAKDEQWKLQVGFDKSDIRALKTREKEAEKAAKAEAEAKAAAAKAEAERKAAAKAEAERAKSEAERARAKAEAERAKAEAEAKAAAAKAEAIFAEARARAEAEARAKAKAEASVKAEAKASVGAAGATKKAVEFKDKEKWIINNIKVLTNIQSLGFQHLNNTLCLVANQNIACETSLSCESECNCASCKVLGYPNPHPDKPDKREITVKKTKLQNLRVTDSETRYLVDLYEFIKNPGYPQFVADKEGKLHKIHSFGKPTQAFNYIKVPSVNVGNNQINLPATEFKIILEGQTVLKHKNNKHGMFVNYNPVKTTIRIRPETTLGNFDGTVEDIDPNDLLYSNTRNKLCKLKCVGNDERSETACTKPFHEGFAEVKNITCKSYNTS